MPSQSDRKEDGGVARPDLRTSRRLITISRIAMIEAGGQFLLAKVNNISDGGVEVVTSAVLRPGSRLRLHLSTLISLEAVVVWRTGRSHGLAFSVPIDCATLLRQLVQDTRAGKSRAFRITIARQAIAASRIGVQAVTVENISQRGVLVRHDANWEVGMPVTIALPGCSERRGTVRWSRDGRAGVSLTDPFTLDEIALQTGLEIGPATASS